MRGNISLETVENALGFSLNEEQKKGAECDRGDSTIISEKREKNSLTFHVTADTSQCRQELDSLEQVIDRIMGKVERLQALCGGLTDVVPKEE